MKYAVVDLTGTKTQAELTAYAIAQQIQLRTDYASHYDGDGVDDEVRAIATEADLAPDESPIRINPTAPNAGELGVHDRLPDGRPVCNVYKDLLDKYNESWTSDASHEVLESRDDARLHHIIDLDDGTIIDCEICDRVEADSYSITVTMPDGSGTVLVAMSNFNTPACFEPNGPAGSEQYDHMNLSKAPNEVRPGGYAQQLDPEKGWVQITHDSIPPSGYRTELDARGLSRSSKRRARRAKPVDQKFDSGQS